MDTFSFSSRVDKLIFQVTKFAEEHIDISGALLVGSYARGDARPDSDLDICFLSNNKETFFESYDWLLTFGEMQSIENETWGPVSTLRVKFSDGFEVEFNFSDPSWAKTDPIDTGTFTVVAGGAKVLYDPLGLLEKLQKKVALNIFEQAPVEYNASWPCLYRQEVKAISEKCSGLMIQIEHIGSTSIPGMFAKPILDILIVMRPGKLENLIIEMERLNYSFMGENGILGRSYFKRIGVNSRTSSHVHCFEEGHPEIEKHIAFRKYLLSHVEIFNQYIELKRKIVSVPGVTRDRYQFLKNDFLRKTTADALVWSANRSKNDRFVQKVVIYALRRKHGNLEVLVFDHLKFMEVSPQLPSGTVEADENIEAAARRELREESGIISSKDFHYLGSNIFYKQYNDQFQERHIFAVTEDSIPEEWIHSVTGSGVDKDLLFKYYWLPTSLAHKKLQAQLGDGLVFFSAELENLL